MSSLGNDDGSGTTSSSGVTSTGRLNQMIPYFHKGGGDHLFFKPWIPSSPGAIAGASFALVFLAILERFVNGVRGRLEGYWASSALHKSAESVVQDENASCNKLESSALPDGSKLNLPPRKRTVPPFILSHDLPRGIVYMVQATLSYALMLAVMTFNAAYFVSIIAGLAIGEVMFGRWALAAHH